jgi:hypothetical protein
MKFITLTKFSKFKYLRLLILIISCSAGTTILAQQSDNPPAKKIDFKLHEKGKFYINWGYNISWYNKSDIHFSGQGHDFILYDVVAHDRPSELSLDYVKLTTWSIPQFNFRFGYFIRDKLSISIGWDHMKYVADDNQTVKMYGYLDPSQVSDPLMQSNMEKMNSKYSSSGLYNDLDVEMTPTDFNHYEHTDGLNYASVDIERYFKLWQCPRYDRFGISLVTGAGLGLIIPRTDCHLFGSGENHFWNVAGWGSSLKIGLQINVTKVIYLQSDFKYGYLQMSNVHTSIHKDIDKATQHIVFYENYWLIGFRF